MRALRWWKPVLALVVLVLLVSAVAFRDTVKEGLRRSPFAFAIAKALWIAAQDIEFQFRPFYRTIGREAAIRDYMNSHAIRKLHIGAGDKNRPGWLNTDIEPRAGQVFLDATRRFPIEDQSFHYVASEHVIEHLGLEDGRVMLSECARVLRRGGRVRIVTPDLRKLTALLGEQQTDDARRYLRGKIQWHRWPDTPTPACVILNYEMRDFGHRFLYDASTLRAVLEGAGFRPVAATVGESEDPELRSFDSRAVGQWSWENTYESMVWEGVKL